MTTVKRRTRPSKKTSKKHAKRVSLKSKKRSKRPAKRKKAKRTRRNQRGGVGERDAAKKAVKSMRALPKYDRGPRVDNAFNCHSSELRKQQLISIGYNEYDKTPAIMSVVRSLAKISNEQFANMGKNEIDMNYNEWRLSEAERRKELRGLKRQGIPSVRSPKARFKVNPSDRVRDRDVPSAPSTSRTMKIKSNQESDAAYEAALAMLELEKSIEEEIDADAIRELQECNLDDSQDMDYTDPAPTITEDNIPPGFTPSKVKPVDDESNKTKPKSLFEGPIANRWTPNKNDNMNDWSLHSTRDADEEDQFMQLMEMGDDMDIGVPPITKST
jgi:hypothetical protein